MDWLEGFWENLFSRQKSQIESAWGMLDNGQRKDVRDHLCRMVTELDWHKDQVDAAQIALDVIDRMKLDGEKENGS